MYVLAVVLLFSGLCAAQTKSNEKEITSEYDATINRCAQKLGVTSDYVETSFQNNFRDEPDEKVKCVVACVYENHLKLKDDGSLDIEASSTNVSKDLKISERNAVIKAIHTCSNIKKDNECDTIFKIVACIMKILSKSRY